MVEDAGWICAGQPAVFQDGGEGDLIAAQVCVQDKVKVCALKRLWWIVRGNVLKFLFGWWRVR